MDFGSNISPLRSGCLFFVTSFFSRQVDGYMWELVGRLDVTRPIGVAGGRDSKRPTRVTEA